VCEEFLFRGPIMTGMRRRLPMWPAIIVTALLFAAAHLDLYGLPIRTFRFSINYLMWLFALLLVDHYFVATVQAQVLSAGLR